MRYRDPASGTAGEPRAATALPRTSAGGEALGSCPRPSRSRPIPSTSSWRGRARAVLKVPVGHPLAGRADGAARRSRWTSCASRVGPRTRARSGDFSQESAKSAICAVLALGHLVGPLRQPGWRGAVASACRRRKRRSFASQIEGDRARKSGLDGLRFRAGAVSRPGGVRYRSAGGALKRDRTAGHSSSFDLVIVDEIGLMPERSRDLLAGLRSSVSAKNGRTIHISVRGDSPLYAEILNNPAVVKRIYAAPDGCELDDVDAWHAANPGLACGIKSLAYMRAEVSSASAGHRAMKTRSARMT